MCRGEVRVNLGEETYYNGSDFTQEIIDLIMGKIEKEDFWVGDNNWFQLELLRELDGKHNIEKYEYVNGVNDYLDTTDIEGCLDSEDDTMGTMLYKIMINELFNMKNHFKEELADLDLSNL